MKNKKAPVKKKIVVKKTALLIRRKVIYKEPTKELHIGVHSLHPPKGSRFKRKLLGRGPSSGHGKTSTRGSKGQTSRSGRNFYLGFEGGQMPLIRKIPKRGFTSKFKKVYQILNLADLNRLKEPNITLEILQQKGLIKDKTGLVKILGEGEIKNPVTIQVHAASKSALNKITKGGGKVEIVYPGLSLKRDSGGIRKGGINV